MVNEHQKLRINIGPEVLEKIVPMTMVDLNHWQRHNGPIESFYFFEFFKPINEPRSNFNLVLLGNGLDRVTKTPSSRHQC